MNKIIFKITDKRQYILSHAYKDIDLESIAKNTSKIILFNDNNNFKQKVLSAADAVEIDNNINLNNLYIFPIFYNHAEHEDSLTLWRTEVDNYLNENIELFSKSNIVIALCDPYEASIHLQTTVDNILSKFKINLVVITANKKLFIQKCKIIYNDTWIERFPPRSEIINYNPNKLYINLTRVARYHRCLLVESLINNNLLKIGYNSWGNTYDAFAQYKKLNLNTKIDKQNFDVLDIKNLSEINPNYVVPELHCVNSFLFLNTETTVDRSLLFFSEKTYKPIGIGMPFITLGNPGTLQDLRNRGFLTFSEWFDESYDLDVSIENRIKIIIKNLKKYSKYNFKDLILIRNEMKDVLNYNLSLYKILRKKNYLRENLLLYMKRF